MLNIGCTGLGTSKGSLENEIAMMLIDTIRPKR
jgi:hypothetical protein